MSDTQNKSVEENASELLQQVMRGERFIWMPPGGWAWSLLVPSLFAVYFAIGWLLSASVSRLGERDAGVTPVVWAIGLSIGLMVVSTVPHMMVIRGYAVGRTWMIRVVRGLTLLGGALSVWALLGDVEASRAVGGVCLASLVVPNLLVTSRAYLAATCYMSLKRKWELEHKAQVDEILAQGRRRRRKRR